MKTGSLLLISMISLLAGCANPNTAPGQINAKNLISARSAITSFQADERLQPYFVNAVAYAIYPNIVRAGMGIGAAYGNGWVFRGESLEGKTRVMQINIGAQIIAEGYRHIIFFETEEAYRNFRDNKVEFAGQANAALLLVGASLTPAYQNHVAAFSQLKAGAGLEASVGVHRYSFIPVIDEHHPQ